MKDVLEKKLKFEERNANCSKKLNNTSSTAESVSILYLTNTSISLAVMGYRLVFLPIVAASVMSANFLSVWIPGGIVKKEGWNYPKNNRLFKNNP